MANYDVTTAASSLEFETVENAYNSCYTIDDNHFINFYSNVDSDGYVQVFTVNTSTWAVTTANSNLEFDTQNGTHNSCYKIDTNHFINFYSGLDSDGYVQVFTVNTSTWAVTTAAASLEFDTQNGEYNNCCVIDENHFINFWKGVSADGYVQVFTVNTSTWEVTTAAGVLEFDTVETVRQTCLSIDSNHFINFWTGSGNDGFVQVFEVNTSTWVVTTAADRLEYDPSTGVDPKACKIDDNHFINFWSRGNAAMCQVFEVNTSTWEVSTAGNEKTYISYSATVGKYNSCLKLTENHVINFYQGEDNDGYAQVFEINTSTWRITTVGSRIEYDTNYGYYNSCSQIDTNHVINFWRGNGDDGYVQTFTVELPTSNTGAFFQLF